MTLKARLLPFLAAAVLAAPVAWAGAPPRVMGLEDLQSLAAVGPPRLSPDGQWALYTVTQPDAEDDKPVSRLWMVSWDGRQSVQLTWGKTSASNPRWSPDGRWIAFVAEREEAGGAKGAQVWVLDRRGGEAHAITDVKQSLGAYAWSPDSRRLALELTDRDEPLTDKGAKPAPPKPVVIDRYHFKEDMEGYLTELRPHLYLYDLASRSLARLTAKPAAGAPDYAEENPAWSPDGARIAFVSNQATPDPDRVANHDIFVAPATPGGTPKRLTSFPGEDIGPLAWTTDGTRILFREGRATHYSIYDQPRLAMVAADGGDPAILAPGLDQWVGEPVVAPGGTAALTTVAEDRQEYVAEIPLAANGVARRLTTASGTAIGLDAAGGHVAVLWTSDAAPPEIFALEDGVLRKLTGHNDALLAAVTLAPTEDLAARSSDGAQVHALLTLPPGRVAGTRPPLLLRIHGGPTAQDAHGFSPDRQLFAAHGYAVLNVNYRGSTGRGHAWSEAINADWGDKEVKDLLAAVDAAIATGKVDPQRLGIGGWSYGGILTDYTIATTGRFKAATSGAGMGNLLGFYGIDEYIQQYEAELGPPWKNLAPYLKLSYPFLHADRITTPTLFMGGDKDFNVPLAGGEQMYQALKSIGTPAELIVYPGEFHGFKRPSFIKDRYQRWFAWYDRYVKGVAAAATPAP
jgi:dipeptidyl aminopeptidase/acylaminoacyl peptidase